MSSYEGKDIDVGRLNPTFIPLVGTFYSLQTLTLTVVTPSRTSYFTLLPSTV